MRRFNRVPSGFSFCLLFVCVRLCRSVHDCIAVSLYAALYDKRIAQAIKLNLVIARNTRCGSGGLGVLS